MIPSFTGIRRVCIILISAVLALATIELLLHTFPPRELVRVTDMHPFLHHDDLLGYTMDPNLRRWVLSEDGHTEYLVETNDLGLRDIPWTGSSGRQVILGLGDSKLFGDGVKREDALMAQMQGMLDRRTPGRYQTINAGMLGYSFNQEMIYYLSRGAKRFDPKVVVLFFNINDMTVYMGKDRRTFEGIPVPAFDEGLYKKKKGVSGFDCRIWKLVRLRWNAIARRAETAMPASKKFTFINDDARFFNREWTSESQEVNPEMVAAFQSFKAKVEEKGAKLLVVYLPSAEEVVEGKARQDIYRNYTYPRSSWNWDRPGMLITRDLKKLAGIQTINLVPVFKDHMQKTGQPLFIRGEGHFTPEGHRVAAEAVGAAIEYAMTGTGTGQDVSDAHSVRPTEYHANAGPSKPADIRWMPYGYYLRRTIAHTGGVYQKVLRPHGNRPDQLFRFFIHPESGGFVLTLSDTVGIIIRQEIPPRIGTWGEIKLGISELKSAASLFILSLQPKNPREPILFSEPQITQPAGPMAPPVIIIAMDSLRADHLPMHGYSRNTAPGLSDLARQSAVFDDATAPSPSSRPSNVSILTGVDPYSHMVVQPDAAIPPLFPTLAELLADAGYATAAAVDSPFLGRATLSGFQSVFENPGTYLRNLSAHREFATDCFEKWRGQSFFLYIHSHMISHPYTGDDFIGGSTEETRESIVARYDAGIRRADSDISAFFSDLKRLGIYDHALIIVTGSHGEELGDRPRLRTIYGSHHNNFHQELVHVPLLVKFPRDRAMTPGRVSIPVGLVDIAPTVLDLLDIPMPRVLDGEPLTRLASTGTDEPWMRQRIFLLGASTTIPQDRSIGGMRMGDYKMIEMGDINDTTFRPDRIHMFDLRKDSGERDDISRAFSDPELGSAEDIWKIYMQASIYRSYRVYRPLLKRDEQVARP